MRLYHGSPYDIGKFEYHQTDDNTLQHGFGIYLSTSKYVAVLYNNNGFIYHLDVDINPEQALSQKESLLSDETLIKIINQIEEEHPFIDDYIDPFRRTKEDQTIELLAILRNNNSDTLIFDDLCQMTQEEVTIVAKAYYDICGITHSVIHETIDHAEQSTYIIYNPTIISIVEKEIFDENITTY